MLTHRININSQHHATPETKEIARTFGNPTLEFDGVAEVWVDNLEAWLEIASDQDFLDKILRKFLPSHGHLAVLKS